ncbi:MAG: SDR family oxidoreductase [Candidatus Cyclobacteriaceae bacterium M3_2C_046]
MMLQGKTALITGASRGIGKAIAYRLAGEKVNLVLTGRSEGELIEVADDLKHQYGVRTMVIVADLLKEEAPEAIIEKAIDKTKQLDFLINNAGAALSLAIEKTTIERWNLMMNLNARAPFFLCQAAIPHLRKSDTPVIINISSVVGYKGYINQAAYTASKHALTGWTKVLAQELQDEHFKVHLISPGGVDTDLISEMRPDLDAKALMNPTEIAEIVLFLIKFEGKAVIDEIRVRRAAGKPWA